MQSEFYNDKENGEDFSQAYSNYIAAREDGSLGSLSLKEEEFEYILDVLIEEGEQQAVLELSEIAFGKYPYSCTLLARFCDTLILCGQAVKALEILDEYSGSFAANSVIYFLYGRANISKGKFRHAREYFYKALELQENNGEAVESTCALAQDCIEAANYKEAIYYMNKASKIEQLPYEYYNDYAFCYDRLDMPQEAVESYNMYLDKNPFNDTVWFNMGTVQARLKEFDKAIEAFEYSIALNGENASSLYNLAVVYMNLQRYAEAAEVFGQFVKIDKDELGKLGLAECCIRLNRFADAMEQLSQISLTDEKGNEAKAGIAVVGAIENFNRGDTEGFKEQFLAVCNTSTAWIGVIYDMLPELQNLQWFLEFLNNIKK